MRINNKRQTHGTAAYRATRMRPNIWRFRDGVWVLLLLSTAACVSTVSTRTVPLGSGSESLLPGSSITLANRPRPDFAVMISSKMGLGAQFGAIAGAITGASPVTTGNQIVADNHIEDPAPRIGKTLLTELATTYHLNVVTNAGIVVNSQKPEAIARRYPGSDSVLDVGTISWGVSYYPTDFSHYRVLYSVKLNLVDTKTGRNIAEAFCARKPEKTPDAPTYQELLANGAARLKSAINASAQSCLEELRHKLHGV